MHHLEEERRRGKYQDSRFKIHLEEERRRGKSVT